MVTKFEFFYIQRNLILICDNTSSAVDTKMNSFSYLFVLNEVLGFNKIIEIFGSLMHASWNVGSVSLRRS
jgi:hypothetical protein